MKEVTEEQLDIVGLRNKIIEWYDVRVEYVTCDHWDVWYLHKDLPRFDRGVWRSDWAYELGYEDDSPVAKSIDNYAKCIWSLS